MSKLTIKKALDILDFWSWAFPETCDLKTKTLGLIAHDRFLLKNS